MLPIPTVALVWKCYSIISVKISMLQQLNCVFTSMQFRWDKLQLKVQDTVQSVFAGELGSPLIGRYPFLVPAYLAAGFKVIKAANPDDKPQLEQLPYAIHFRYGLKYATVYDMEFAFPVNFNDSEHGFDAFLSAIHAVVDEIADAAKGGKAQITYVNAFTQHVTQFVMFLHEL